MRAGIAAIDGVRVLGDGTFHCVAMAADGPGVDVFAVGDLLPARGLAPRPPDTARLAARHRQPGQRGDDGRLPRRPRRRRRRPGHDRRPLDHLRHPRVSRASPRASDQVARSRDENAAPCDVRSSRGRGAREHDAVADVRLEGPLDLRTLAAPARSRAPHRDDRGRRLPRAPTAPPGAARSSPSTTARSTSCWPTARRQRLHAGALLFVAGLRDVELRCAGPTPAVLTGHPPRPHRPDPSCPSTFRRGFAAAGPKDGTRSGQRGARGTPARLWCRPHDGSVTEHVLSTLDATPHDGRHRRPRPSSLRRHRSPAGPTATRG